MNRLYRLQNYIYICLIYLSFEQMFSQKNRNLKIPAVTVTGIRLTSLERPEEFHLFCLPIFCINYPFLCQYFFSFCPNHFLRKFPIFFSFNFLLLKNTFSSFIYYLFLLLLNITTYFCSLKNTLKHSHIFYSVAISLWSSPANKCNWRVFVNHKHSFK